MNIIFVSNYINHHQIPFCDAIYRLTEGNFLFFQTEPMEEERISMGWDAGAINKPYVKLYYEDKEVCDKMLLESDCVIFGGCEDESVIRPRLLTGKFTIRYSERLYKDGRWKFVSPRGLIKKYHDHTIFKKNDLFLLCAGAYVKGDFSLIRAYSDKMLKYGYFPKAYRYDDIHELRRNNERMEILWAARFIDWKHPEMMVRLAVKLKENNINAHITMIGSGELFDSIHSLTDESGVSDYLSFTGSKTPDEVRDYMRKADLFISTSDMKEGWGAVVNEAMNSGCVVIASDKMGVTPYLIKDGVNGFSYKAKSDTGLWKAVKYAFTHEDELEKIGSNAYDTIVNLWNADTAAERLYNFICDSEHKIPEYKDGPVSRA